MPWKTKLFRKNRAVFVHKEDKQSVPFLFFFFFFLVSFSYPTQVKGKTKTKEAGAGFMREEVGWKISRLSKSELSRSHSGQIYSYFLPHWSCTFQILQHRYKYPRCKTILTLLFCSFLILENDENSFFFLLTYM